MSSSTPLLVSTPVTGTGFGIQVSKIGGQKLKVQRLCCWFIGYITNEGDASNPASYTICRRRFGRDTASVCPSSSPEDIHANYAYERGMNSMGKVGTELAKNPFDSNPTSTVSRWRTRSDRFQITGAYGGNSMNSRYDSSVIGIDMVNAGDSAQTNSWMIGLNFKDVFIEGWFRHWWCASVSSNDSGWGTDGSMPIALETWYQFQVSDNISVTPGVPGCLAKSWAAMALASTAATAATAAPTFGAEKLSSSSDLSPGSFTSPTPLLFSLHKP